MRPASGTMPGLSADDAAREISLDVFRGWLGAERVFVNVQALYRELSEDPELPEILELFAGMARLTGKRA